MGYQRSLISSDFEQESFSVYSYWNISKGQNWFWGDFPVRVTRLIVHLVSIAISFWIENKFYPNYSARIEGKEQSRGRKVFQVL